MAVAVYATAVFLPFLDGGSRTLTRHEVLITHPALQVLENGDWVIPHYTGKPWVDKPPLITWVTAGLFELWGGFDEIPARLPAAASAILLCVLVAIVAARFHGNMAGLLAGLVQASCVYMYMQGRLGEIDMPFALLIAAASAAPLWRWGRGEPLCAGATWAFHMLIGLAVLAKGPLGAILPGATVLCFCVFQRSWRPLRAVLLTPAVMASIGIGLSWHVAVVMRLGSEGFERLWYTYFARAAGLHHLGSQNPLLYFYTIPWLVLPWSAVLAAGVIVIGARVVRRSEARRSAGRSEGKDKGVNGGAGRAAWLFWLPVGLRMILRRARRSGAEEHRFLWAWFFGGLVVLTLTAFKHKHYCIPILPPLSIFCGQMMAAHLGRAGRRAGVAYATAFAVILIGFTLVSGVLMPGRDYRRETAAFVRAATAEVPPGERLFVVGLAQSAVYAYLSRPCDYADTPEELAAAVRSGDGPVWVLTTRANIAEGERAGLAFQEASAERERRKVPRAETLALGRVAASVTSAPRGEP